MVGLIRILFPHFVLSSTKLAHGSECCPADVLVGKLEREGGYKKALSFSTMGSVAQCKQVQAQMTGQWCHKWREHPTNGRFNFPWQQSPVPLKYPQAIFTQAFYPRYTRHMVYLSNRHTRLEQNVYANFCKVWLSSYCICKDYLKIYIQIVGWDRSGLWGRLSMTTDSSLTTNISTELHSFSYLIK